MTLTRFALLFSTFLMACDADKDGLTNSEEEELGTDPESADSDGDGIDDAVEIEQGTDPTNADSDEDGLSDGEEDQYGSDPLSEDSDGDTYWDAWEVTEGTDPTDPDSRIYTGYWPYNPDKGDDLPGYDDTNLDEGAPIPEFVLMDRFEDMVNAYDFQNDTAYVMVDLSAVWCGPCNGFAEWLHGESDSYGFNNYWPNIPGLVESGDLYWLTVLGENRRGNVPDADDLNAWYESYPDDRIPILAVEEDISFTYFFIDSGWPSIYLYNPDLTLNAGPGRSSAQYYQALDIANDL